MYVYVPHTCLVPLEAKEGVKFTGNGVTGGYESLDQTHEPWKSSKCLIYRAISKDP